MSKYAVIGWPIEHSLSPPMQKAGFRELGISATYEKIAVPPAELAASVARLRRGYDGWNITVPHKGAVLPLLDHLDPIAARISSVNTVLNRNGILHGYSTDGYGLAAALQESFGLDLRGNRFLFIGAGGAARATAAYVAAHKPEAIYIVNRTLARAEDLLELIQNTDKQCETGCCSPEDRTALKQFLSNIDVIIQATSLGLQPDDPTPLDAGMLPAGTPVYDMIYRETRFLQAAEAKGCPVADGAGMLLHQGARSLELWTGRKAPVPAMRRALATALDNRGFL